MSKIAEKIHNVALQKAEEYSKTHGNSIVEEVAYGRGYKTAYIECYEQAMKDFLEKALKYLAKNLLVSDLEHKEYLCMTEENKDNFIQDFKNYMKDESKN